MAKLRIAFIGKDYFFNRTLCRWLAGHADLRLIVWTDRIAWPHRRGFFWAWARIARRILSRGHNGGPWRAIDEFAFYVLYVLFLRRREEERSRRLVESVRVHEAIDHVRQESPTRIDDPRLLAMLESLRLDAVFAMCVDSYFPPAAFAMRRGTESFCGTRESLRNTAACIPTSGRSCARTTLGSVTRC